MVHLNIKGMKSREVNRKLRELVLKEKEIFIEHPDSIHNFATALKGDGKVVVRGSTGFYTGGFLEGPTLIIQGNTGLYTGDNMMRGMILIEKNSGSNVGPSMIGGTIVVKGHCGSWAGFGMKGGTLLICGNAGMWTGKMMLGGRIIVLGSMGMGTGDSIYNGVIHTLDRDVEKKLGSNVQVVSISQEEKEEVHKLLERYGINRNIRLDDLKSVVPKVYGRHEYVLFKPTHLGR
ncbi:MAG: glutamate synthase [Deltaproteobacteria bacterium]|nr:glutamate synthase [Deltaproteobacteria bacterium]